MDAYLIPMGRQRYELYCEPAGDAAEVGSTSDEPAPGFVGRVRHRFAEMLRAAEERQRSADPAGDAPGLLGRMQERVFSWVAERIAEQRLLWRLRRQTEATVVHPQDMAASDACAIVQQVLQRDYDRHRRWLIIDTLAFAATGLLAILPGPNIVAYYFAFRVWGHWLSMRGATQGLHHVTWAARPCPVLAELRDVDGLEPTLRTARVRDVAARLHLPHLATFFERLVVRPHHA